MRRTVLALPDGAHVDPRAQRDRQPATQRRQRFQADLWLKQNDVRRSLCSPLPICTVSAFASRGKQAANARWFSSADACITNPKRKRESLAGLHEALARASGWFR